MPTRTVSPARSPSRSILKRGFRFRALRPVRSLSPHRRTTATAWTTTPPITLATAPPSPSRGLFTFAIFAKFVCSGARPQTPPCADSVVDFRLRGNFGSSIVELRHTALASADEYAWHDALWRRSRETCPAFRVLIVAASGPVLYEADSPRNGVPRISLLRSENHGRRYLTPSIWVHINPGALGPERANLPRQGCPRSRF